MKKYLLIILVITNSILFADNKSRTALVFYPYAMYSNETSFVLGTYLMYISRPQNLEMHIPPTSIIFNGTYSLKKQTVLTVQPELQMMRGKYSISFPTTYKNWPSSFYGIGNNTKEDSKEKYTMQEIEFQSSFKIRFSKKWAIDLFYEMDDYKILKTESTGELNNHSIAGSENCFISGLGLSIIRDTRDNTFYSTSGGYYKFGNIFFEDFLGSDYSFSKHSIDFRRFFHIALGHSFAFQTMFSYTKYEAPFRKLADLGSKMRGYDSNRFIDNHRLIVRSEYRLFPWETRLQNRVGLAFFIETGQVSRNLDAFRFTELKCSGGAGLRFMLLPNEKLTLRIDYAIGNNSSDLILTSKEAF